MDFCRPKENIAQTDCIGDM